MIPRPARSILIACMCLFARRPALSQTARAPGESPWVGQRIVMLKGMGEVHLFRRTASVFATAVGINLVVAEVADLLREHIDVLRRSAGAAA